jgi:hypothetical protein
MSGYIGSKRSSSLVSFDEGTIGSGVVFPAGIVIQTKQFIFSKVANTTSTSMTQITDGSVDFKDSITVKANSKILVRATLTLGSTGNQGFFVGLFKSTDGASFSEITALHNDSSSPTNKGTNAAMPLFHLGQNGLSLVKGTLEYLDTITSAGTYHYALFFRTGSTGRVVVNITPSKYSSGSTNVDEGSSASVMTLMEISG